MTAIVKKPVEEMTEAEFQAHFLQLAKDEIEKDAPLLKKLARRDHYPA